MFENASHGVGGGSSAGFAGATDSWGKDWAGAVEAPSHDLAAIVESAETGRAVDVERER